MAMSFARRFWQAIWFSLVLAACSPATPASAPPVPPAPSPTVAAISQVATPTAQLDKASTPVLFPVCKGMQKLKDPIEFDWPNLREHIDEFIGTAWEYYACEQPAAEVAQLYRQQLPLAPYNLEETNWLERQEGTLGIYFSQTGAWNYVWFIPQPGDPQKSYVIVTESFASVDC